jgi:hypothetical protein
MLGNGRRSAACCSAVKAGDPKNNLARAVVDRDPWPAAYCMMDDFDDTHDRSRH